MNIKRRAYLLPKIKRFNAKKTVNNVKYPNTEISKGKIIFSLSDMITVCKLTQEQLTELKKYSSRSYEYLAYNE